MHPVPPLPHALSAVPTTHVPAVQHPPHEVVSHTQAPLAQRRPVPQLPVAQTPPHPSSPPQVAPSQLGVQPQTSD
jgi:hypothetical protein